MPETKEPISAEILQQLKLGMRFLQDDIDKIERLAPILGRCHEMINKIEQFISMRGDITQMADVSAQLLQVNEMSKTNYNTVQ